MTNIVACFSRSIAGAVIELADEFAPDRLAELGLVDCLIEVGAGDDRYVQPMPQVCEIPRAGGFLADGWLGWVVEDDADKRIAARKDRFTGEQRVIQDAQSVRCDDNYG